MEQEWVPQEGTGTPDGFARLWTPHRLAYIQGAGDTGCPFCRIARGRPWATRRTRTRTTSSSPAATRSTPC